MNPFTEIENLWHEHHDGLLRHAKRYVGSDLAEDVVQDVYCATLKVLLDGRKLENPSGWLYRVQHNLIVDSYRNRDVRQEYALEYFPRLEADQGNPVRHAESSEDAAIVDRVLSQLNEAQRAVMVMRYIDGCTFDEIAAEMDKNYEAVKAILRRGLVTANRLLGGEGRPTRTQGRQHEVKEAIRQHGPMTVTEIAKVAGLLPREVRSAIYTNESQFCRVGTRNKGRVEIYVWGVAGVHDKAAA